jgi:hypothetical protein
LRRQVLALYTPREQTGRSATPSSGERLPTAFLVAALAEEFGTFITFHVTPS